MKTNNISSGLFMFRGTQFWRNIKDVPIFIKRIFFVLKHGYSPVAKWETFTWFIAVMKEILTNYRYNRVGDPIVVDKFFNDDGTENEDENHEAYNKILDKMIGLLDQMDESNPVYDDMDWEERDKMQVNAKSEFFKLFSEYFFSLWD